MTGQEKVLSDAGITPAKVRVELGDNGYDILIGQNVLPQAGQSIKNVFGQVRCAVITDENVARLHLETLKRALEAAGLEFSVLVLPAGEATKSYNHLEQTIEHLLTDKIERNDLVVAFGGGVIGDLAGFAAAVLRRGVRFVQIPTTLLAQVDSSVGGKTGINSPQGKNLVGAFHQPGLVLADIDVLDTLERRQFAAGYAEIVKYGLIADAPFFDWLEENGQAVFAGDKQALIYAIETSCKAKAAIVAADEKEKGQRALLNLGHTFGHALEAWAGYDGTLLHGEGVAIGMVMAHEFSELNELAKGNESVRIRQHFHSLGLPVALEDLDCQKRPEAGELLEHMAQDKKVAGGKLTFILTNGIGQAFLTRDVDLNRLKAFLEAHCR